MNDFTKQLSEIQYKAVTNYEGASLVIAGAGSGKTRVLTYRIAYMIQQGIAPHHIVALTFTNKAASEMRERITAMISASQSRGIVMGTFHSIFGKILRAEATTLGFTDSFTIYEPSDCKNLIKNIVRDLKLDETKYDPKVIYSRISLAKNNLVTPQIYEKNEIALAEDRKRGMSEFVSVYRNYMFRCKQNNAMDFDDLLLYTNILFRDHPQALEKYRDRFRYVLVDEYQDTNSAQYLIVRKLVEKHGNICVVGDDAQSIYSFRGAKIENILRFQKDYPQATVIKLEENYRSTQNIVGAANCVIAKNSRQLKKTVFSSKPAGEKITLIRSFTDKDEAVALRKEIESQAAAGVSYGDMAILYRTNSQSKALEDQLRVRQIPYKIHKGQSFYQRAEIKNILAYVRLVANESDDEAFRRIINFPARGIGAVSIEKMATVAQDRKLSLWNAVALTPPEEIGLKGATAKSVATFVAVIEKYREASTSQDAYTVVYDLIREAGILSLYRDNTDPEAQSAYENIEELVNSLKQQCEQCEKEEGKKLLVKEWIQDVTLLTDVDTESKEEGNRVTLMTIHSAKGLEYDTVFIAGMEEGTFPSQRSVESVEEIEEERRLFYVAVTRAIRKLVVSYSLSRYKWGSSMNTIPSRFIAEIDARYYDDPELMTARGAYAPESETSSATDTFSRGGYSGRYGSSREENGYGSRSSSGVSGTKYDTPPPVRRSDPSAGLKSLSKLPHASATEPVAGEIVVGSRVEHDRFGRGEVVSLEEGAGDVRVTVKFDISGQKTLLLRFAKLKKIG